MVERKAHTDGCIMPQHACRQARPRSVIAKQKPGGLLGRHKFAGALFASFIILLLVAPLFPATAFDQYVATQQTAFTNRLNSWWLLSIVAIMICVFFNTLIYMMATFFQSEELKNYAKSEFLQVSASSLMIFFAVALLFTVTSGAPSAPVVSAFSFFGDLLGNGASSISCAAAPNGRFSLWDSTSKFGTGPIGGFKCKLQEKINALDTAYDEIVKSNYAAERVTSICVYLLGVPAWCGDWDLALHKTVEENHMIAGKIVDISVSLNAQFTLAEYIQKNMLTVFLPFGLFLRILPLTRGVGGLFIAMGVGFFFVWPTFFIMSDPSFIKAVSTPDDSKTQGICYTGFRGSSVLLAGTVEVAGPGSPSDLAAQQGRDIVYQMSVATLFYPFVALVITLIFVRAMTPLLGGDMGELMKMVSRLG